MKSTTRIAAALLLFVFTQSHALMAQSSLAGETLHISRATGADQDRRQSVGRRLAGTVKPVTTWYEVNPGDNTPPKVRNVGRIAYDDRFLYAAFEFDDPNPRAIRAPYSDRDDSGGGFYDFGGIFVDAGNSGHTAKLFVVTPRNIQADSVIDDASGEAIIAGLLLGIGDEDHRLTDGRSRCGFRSRRFATRTAIPRPGPSCCTATIRATATTSSSRRKCRAGTTASSATPTRSKACSDCRPAVTWSPRPTSAPARPPVRRPASDRRWRATRCSSTSASTSSSRPTPDTAVDLTVKPDFSQVESDVAQISANERFALFVPEKRSFFLEGVDLFQTPIQAVYTRTITAPSWGGRITGKAAGVRYTALVVEDDGGGSVVLPGAHGSSLASQDFASTVFVARAKRDIGRSFISMLVTDREGRDIGVVQPRARPRFPVAPECHRGDHRAVARQRHAHAESAGPCAGVDGPVDDLARGPASVEPQHDAL